MKLIGFYPPPPPIPSEDVSNNDFVKLKFEDISKFTYIKGWLFWDFNPLLSYSLLFVTEFHAM
jgi:hypothetical protein